MNRRRGESSSGEGIVLIGVGNECRRDDGAGLRVVRTLRRTFPDSVGAVETPGEPAEMMEAWEGTAAAYVFDAVEGGEDPPGHVYRFRPREEPLPGRLFRVSTHGFGPVEAVEIARRLGGLPETVLVYGIRGGDFGSGTGLSGPVSVAVRRVVREMEAELEPRVRRGEHGCTSKH